MKQYRISTGTITYAIKGRDLLRHHGYKVGIERGMPQSGAHGCGYSIIVYGSIEKPLELLHKAGVKVLDVSEI